MRKQIWLVYQQDNTYEYEDSVHAAFDNKEEANIFADVINKKQEAWEMKIFNRITNHWRYYVEEAILESSAEEALAKRMEV